MRDVAAVAGVSVKTVSRVVNDERGVSPQLVHQVLEAVQLLDYRPNRTASSLRRSDQKTASIGLLLENVANPFSSALHRAVEDVARSRDTVVFAASNDEDPVREREMLLAFVSRRVDGLITVPVSRDQSHLARERRLGTPLVFVDRPAAFTADSVTVDNRAATAAAVRHLARRGHRRIAFLGDLRTIWTAAERHLGYVEGLAAEGLRLEERLVRRDLLSPESAGAAVLDLLDGAHPPTALLASQNLITIGAIQALQMRGLQHRVAVVGFDDVVLADLLDPAVSVVAQDVTTVGRKAAQLLFNRLDGHDGPPRHVVVPTRFISRGSGEIPPP
jgi:LacI family transcriptional regulator